MYLTAIKVLSAITAGLVILIIVGILFQTKLYRTKTNKMETIGNFFIGLGTTLLFVSAVSLFIVDYYYNNITTVKIIINEMFDTNFTTDEVDKYQDLILEKYNKANETEFRYLKYIIQNEKDKQKEKEFLKEF
jgi:hypothetical protein